MSQLAYSQFGFDSSALLVLADYLDEMGEEIPAAEARFVGTVVRKLESLGIDHFATGSRVFGGWKSTGAHHSDWDFCCITGDDNLYRRLPVQYEADPDYPSTQSLRIGVVNLIVCETDEEYQAWLTATQAMTTMSVLRSNKRDRVRLFSRLRRRAKERLKLGLKLGLDQPLTVGELLHGEYDHYNYPRQSNT